MSFSLNSVYQSIGISKQAFHQRMERRLKEHAYEHQLLFLIYEVRKDHPTMGCRDMWYFIKPDFIGRDKFELFCKRHGLVSERHINYSKTTNSTGVIRFIDITIDLKITHINQVWVSDITYYALGDKFYYITFIMDAFSRRIIGYNVSKRLFTSQTTLPALEMAIQVRKGMNLVGTIFHSDGGGQYYDHDFLALTEKIKLRNSMCEYPWDNGKAERINGVIKNNYLKHREINSFSQLKQEVDRSVQLYNEEKPHIALKRLSPIMFEKSYICSGKTSDGEKVNDGIKKLTDPGRKYSPADCGKTSSRSKITLE